MSSTNSRRFDQPPVPGSVACQKAHRILCNASDACESFHVIFRAVQDTRGRGTTTDAQQDTLRAMLVFACAGLDASLKQLVRDALASVIANDKGAEAEFTKAVTRKLAVIELSRDLLANVLTATDPRGRLIKTVESDLLDGSLQSLAQVNKIAAAFNVKIAEIHAISELREAFDVRNQIIHEMDVNFGTNRSRNPRRLDDMERLTKAVLDATAGFLSRVDSKLQ